MFTDRLSLFDMMTKATILSEKRMMIYLKYLKSAYELGDIYVKFFIRSKHNLADALKNSG